MIIKAVKNNKEIDLSLLGSLGFKSNLDVTYKCDNCGKKKTLKLESLLRHQTLEKQYCLSCSIKLNNIVADRIQ